MIRVRIARASRDLAAAEKFYRHGLQLALVDRFVDHAGYDGVILALPGDAQLEITGHARGRIAAPDPDDLLVIYLPSAERFTWLRARLESMGHAGVPALNPYWRGRSVTIEDPDGWRVVLCRPEAAGITTSATSARPAHTSR
ncbi:MAG TPA: VOC family protein [Steroidobacteraceae bacterium]|nr:VOC family protein [Steroidobacteraceae bacterium]